MESSIEVDVSEHSGLSRGDIAKLYAKKYQHEIDSSHYIYCFSFEQDDNLCWYVGETSNLESRISTHAREKDIVEIERVESASNRTDALERERSMSYEVAIEKQSTDIFGGR